MRTKNEAIWQKSLIIGLGYILLVAVVLAAMFKQGATTLYDLVDKSGLNTIGDFLAGIFAPLAFIGLAATYLTQKEQLRIAMDEGDATRQRLAEQAIAEENKARLDLASTQANYKLGLYAERKAVFDQLVNAGDLYKGEVSEEMIEVLRMALFDVRFVFPSDVEEWVLALIENASRLRFAQARATDHEQRQKSRPVRGTTEQELGIDALYDEIRERQKTVFDELQAKALFARLDQYLRLPTEIEFEKVTKSKLN